MNKILEIRNRPMEHYILSILSLIAQGDKKIYLKSYGSVNNKTLDIINLINEIILPQKFDVKIEHEIQKIEIKNQDKYNTSLLLATLRLK